MDVFSYIKTEETNYKTQKVTLGDNWQWNMYDHVNRSFLMKHSKFATGNNDLGKRPFKNIIRPILGVAYRSEGFDIKDIEPYVTDADNYHKSFLVRKFHPRWALDNDMDTFIDEVVESYVDYGLALVKNVNNERPELVPLQRLAFVDQRDVLSGAKCERHPYSVDQLLAQKKYWNPTNIDRAITMSKSEKPNSTGTANEHATTKSIDVYELHGFFPETWLPENKDGDPMNYTRQMHIITYYKDKMTDKDVGIPLFQIAEPKEIYKALVRDGMYNRACGFGGVEELFEPQVWTNYSIIQIKEMLDVASLMLLQTSDPAFSSRNKITDKKKGEIVVTAENQALTQVNIVPVNMQQFRNALTDWETSARTTGSAQDANLGIDPASGTPLGTTQNVIAQGEGIHKFRQGKVSTFFAEIYRDWVLKFLVAEMNKGKEFMETLSLDELRDIGEKMVDNWVNAQVKAKIMKGGMLSQQQVDTFRQIELQKWMKGGVMRFHKVMKDELKGIPVDVMVNIAGKQANLASDVTKLSNIFREIIVNPQGFMQAMQMPAIAKTFNRILEFSGIDQVNFGDMPKQQPSAPMQYGGPAAARPTTAAGMPGQPLKAK